MGLMDVLEAVGIEEKSGTKGPQKRYIMFLLEEWKEKIEKPLGKSMTPEEMKNFLCVLLEKLSKDEWKLITKK